VRPKDELRDAFTRQVNKRKSTAKWCKGKVGREHTPELVLNHNISRWSCGWRTHRFWRQGQWTQAPYRYSCWHAYRCTTCGKYTEYALKNVEECPDYKPLEAQ
jgi:hypothetical protein